jgi:hypothetical protein
MQEKGSRNECHTFDFLSVDKKLASVLLSVSAIKIFRNFVPHVTEIMTFVMKLCQCMYQTSFDVI